MFALGENHIDYKADQNVFSYASVISNCFASIADVINDRWSVGEV
jgi:glyceraldehyde-3-phosphate dehydrogenase/erythrose-4-phosphate dehydrogenase